MVGIHPINKLNFRDVLKSPSLRMYLSNKLSNEIVILSYKQ